MGKLITFKTNRNLKHFETDFFSKLVLYVLGKSSGD